jgi:DNA-binding transcriptional regulator LsrR (DeoR family)
MLYAPAMPSPALRKVLLEDEHVQRVTSLWRTAKAALIGVGAPTGIRSSLPSVLPQDLPEMDAAIGDICTRPFDAKGRPIPFPGSERLVAMELADLRRIPHVIACAVGAAKVPAIRVAARVGYLNTLVTDSSTAQLLLEPARGHDTEELLA